MKIMVVFMDWGSDNSGGDNNWKNEEKRKKKREGEWNLFYVLVICLSQIGIEDVCFHVEILR